MCLNQRYLGFKCVSLSVRVLKVKGHHVDFPWVLTSAKIVPVVYQNVHSVFVSTLWLYNHFQSVGYVIVTLWLALMYMQCINAYLRLVTCTHQYLLESLINSILTYIICKMNFCTHIFPFFPTEFQAISSSLWNSSFVQTH